MFKIGDKVIVVDDMDGNIPTGEICTVIKTRNNNGLASIIYCVKLPNPVQHYIDAESEIFDDWEWDDCEYDFLEFELRLVGSEMNFLDNFL